MPISRNKLMPYSDDPSRTGNQQQMEDPNENPPSSSNARTINRNRFQKAHSQSPSSSHFTWTKFVKNWIMVSRRLKLSDGHRTGNHYLELNRSSNGPTSRLPIRFRPAFLLFTLITLILMGIIGFSRSVHAVIPIPKKLFHFFAFALITGLFYLIPDVEDSSRMIWYWAYFNDIVTAFVCFFLGGFGSEFIQVFLPWKVFEWGDLLANELGCLVGYQISRTLHRQYRNKLELSSLYEPLGPDGSASRDFDLSVDQYEDEDSPAHGPSLSSHSLFASGNPDLSNVWSDRLEEGHEYFRFEEDEET